MAREAGSGKGNENGGAPMRISISIDPSIRRKLRIAAAHADRTVGEWCTDILERAANKAVAGNKAKG